MFALPAGLLINLHPRSKRIHHLEVGLFQFPGIPFGKAYSRSVARLKGVDGRNTAIHSTLQVQMPKSFGYSMICI